MVEERRYSIERSKLRNFVHRSANWFNNLFFPTIYNFLLEDSGILEIKIKNSFVLRESINKMCFIN